GRHRYCRSTEAVPVNPLHLPTLAFFSPAQLRSRGQGQSIVYGLAPGPFGLFFVATLNNDVIRSAFGEGAAESALLQQQWPQALWQRDDRVAADVVQALWGRDSSSALAARVGGTAFQQVVWQALLAVPYGQHCSYQALAVAVGKPQAAQAVGNAVGANPLAGIIPCHRVLPQRGGLGGFRWGVSIKQQLLDWEAGQHRPD